MQNMIRMTMVAGLMVLEAHACWARTPKEQRGQLSAKDYKFVSEAARGGTAEVELGDLAKQKAVSQEITHFCRAHGGRSYQSQ